MTDKEVAKPKAITVEVYERKDWQAERLAAVLATGLQVPAMQHLYDVLRIAVIGTSFISKLDTLTPVAEPVQLLRHLAILLGIEDEEAIYPKPGLNPKEGSFEREVEKRVRKLEPDLTNIVCKRCGNHIGMLDPCTSTLGHEFVRVEP